MKRRNDDLISGKRQRREDRDTRGPADQRALVGVFLELGRLGNSIVQAITHTVSFADL